MLRTIIVDDEEITLKELQSMLEEHPGIVIAGSYTDPQKALDEIEYTKPDCAFLDIEMPVLDGIELAGRLIDQLSTMEVVFVTAYNHYATQAFEVNAIDYVLKPIRPERLGKAVERLLHNDGERQPQRKQECTIRCFGAFEILIGDKAIKWKRSKSKEFIAYMLQNEGKWVTKYRLCEEQWADYEPEQALAYLQIAVYGARKNLREAGCTQLEIEYRDDRYMLKVKEANWDIRLFGEAYQAYHRSGDCQAANTAVQFYREEYLEGEDWLWADQQREHYICLVEKLLQQGLK